jgi:hypothetical protein
MRRSDAKVRKAKLSALDREIAAGLEDIRKGRCYGPFETAEEMISFLHQQAKKPGYAKRSPRTPRAARGQ